MPLREVYRSASHTHPTVVHGDYDRAAPAWARAPGQVVHCSFPTPQKVDWEVELAVVIGRKGKYIKVRRKGWCPLALALENGQPLPAGALALSLVYHL